jgi:hypothetical protein
MGINRKCPICNSPRIRAGQIRSLLDHIRVLLGVFPARCEQCSARFHLRSVGLGAVFYAKCPRCLRQDLTSWDLKHYRPSNWMRVQMLLGARRRRCEVCRCNFVSLRPRKAKYVRVADRLVPGEAPGANRTLA